MKPRGVKSIFQDSDGRFIVLCKDGTMWISIIVNGVGHAVWSQITPIPKRNEK